MRRPFRLAPPREPLFPVDEELLRRAARDRRWSVERMQLTHDTNSLFDLVLVALHGKGWTFSRGSDLRREIESIRDRILRAPNAREIVDAIRSAIDMRADRVAVRILILIESALPPELPSPPPAGAPAKPLP